MSQRQRKAAANAQRALDIEISNLEHLADVEDPSDFDKIFQKIAGDVAQIGLLTQQEEESLIAATSLPDPEEVEVEVCADSGCVDNVINPKHLPRDAQPVPNTSGKHYNGAGGDFIEKFGTCDTLLKGEHGEVGCSWNVADVTRALHSTAQTCGPVEKPRHDVLYNANKCVVVPAGVVDRILAHVKPLMQYNRKGNLYIGKMKMSSFTRPATQA